MRRPAKQEVRLPKGHAEEGESPETTATREVFEETGYSNLVIRADLGAQVVEFDFNDRHWVRKERFFLMELQDRD